VKVRYEGSHEWFSTMQVNEVVKNLKSKGAAKVMIDFNPISTSKEMVDIDLNGEIDYEKLIIERAEEDKQDSETGLRYFRKAVEDAIC
jgi:phosphopantothenate synthetase